MSRTLHLVVTGLAGLLVAACLVAAPGPAGAATPLAGTTYRGTGGQAGVATTVTFTLKVGARPTRITKATVEVSCPTATNKVVFRKVRITDGGFFKKSVHFPGTSATRFRLDGHVTSRHRMIVVFATADPNEPCGNYVMEGTAKG